MIFFIPTNIQDNPDGKDGKRFLLFYIIMSALTIVPAFYSTKIRLFGTLDEVIDMPFIIGFPGFIFWLIQGAAFVSFIFNIINKIVERWK